MGVLFVFIGVAIFSGWVAETKLTTGFELVDLTPDISYVRDYFQVHANMWGSTTGNLPTYLYFKDIDYRDANVQAEMTQV